MHRRCEKCGHLNNGEEAYVNGQFWCHPCADNTMHSAIKDAVRPFGVSIDYDDTFTSCPETWAAVIETLRRAGARVVCVTSRDGRKHPVTDFPGEVFYCAGRPKAEVMHENQVEIHVWIDDQPEYIGLNPERRALKEALGLR